MLGIWQTLCLLGVAQATAGIVQMSESELPLDTSSVRLRYDPYEETWTDFKLKHGKVYEGKEEELRRKIFLDTVKNIEQHNLKYINKETSYYMDINQFSDWTNEEYRQFNCLQTPGEGEGSYLNRTTFLPPLNWKPPSKVDWRTHGYVTRVKNQGKCRCCWAFSTTGSMEGQHFRLTRNLASLSEQQLVDCSRTVGNKGCDDGLMTSAFNYIMSVGGLESETDYPYIARDNVCSFNRLKIVRGTRVTNYTVIPLGSESSLMEAVASQGPISVGIDANHSSFRSYKGGIYDEPHCSSVALDHAVLVVGYGTMNGLDYWIVKNSWGLSWGNRGYILMSRNKKNQCGIATMASYPHLSMGI